MRRRIDGGLFGVLSDQGVLPRCLPGAVFRREVDEPISTSLNPYESQEPVVHRLDLVPPIRWATRLKTATDDIKRTRL